jgi:hypothetical protein
MKRFKKSLALALSVALFMVSFPEASVAVETIKKPKAPCRIQISQAHISSSVFEKLGFRAVKVNAFSKCNVPQSQVTLTVEIWKEGKFGNIRVARTVTKSPGITYPGRNVENFNTWQRCKTYTDSSYFGVAYSKAFIQGKWQYARDTYSLKIKPLACGT